MNYRLLLAIWICAALVCAAEAADPNDTEIARYRRIFAPAQNVEVWPREGEKLLPIEKEEFDASVARINRELAQPMVAMITDAVYRARFEDGQLVDGHATWTIEHRGSRPALVPLPDMSIVVSEVEWQGDSMRSVRRGAWGASGGFPAQFGLEVARPGVLEFNWSTDDGGPRSEVENSQREFDLRLPIARKTQFILDVPAGMRPVVEGGEVIESQELADFRRWVIALPPRSEVGLRIEDHTERPTNGAASFTFDDDLRYELSDRGLDVFAKLRIDGRVPTDQPLMIPLPPGSLLISATTVGEASGRDGRRELNRRIVATTGEERHALIELPESATGRAIEIELQAWVPLRLNEPWRLPRLRPDGAEWMSGSLTLAASSTLELRSITPTDCVQTGVATATDDDGHDAWTFDAYSPAASLEVVFTQRRAEAVVKSGVSVHAGDTEVGGRLVSRFRVERGRQFDASAELRPGWIVEAVETLPADALGDWAVDWEEGRRRLRVRLASAAQADRDVTITVTGRLQRSGLFEPLPADVLRMLTWDGVTVSRELLLVRTVEPYIVESTGALAVTTQSQLSDDDLSLFDEAAQTPGAGGLMFDLSDASPAATLRLTPGRVRFTADVVLDAAWDGERLTQDYRIACQAYGEPGESGVAGGRWGELLVYASAELEADTVWIDSTTGVQLAARQLPPTDHRAARFPTNGQLWLIRLPSRLSDSIAIHATVTSNRQELSDVSLLAVPEAAQQTGRINLRSGAAPSTDHVAGFSLQTDGMSAAPLPIDTVAASTNNNSKPLRATYRYDPVRCYGTSPRPRLRIGASPAGESGSAIVGRHVEIESYYSADGQATHRATYRLENSHAAGHVSWRLPNGTALDAIEVNRKPWHGANGAPTAGVLAIDLPPAQQHVELTLYLREQGEPLSTGRRLEAPLSSTPVSVASGEWVVWLPEDFQAAPLNEGRYAADNIGWAERLFGPLGRASRDVDPTAESTALAAVETNGDAGLAGWHAVRTTFASQPPSIVVAHPPSITAWAIVVFLACLTVGYHFDRRGDRREAFIWLVGGAAALCLLLPSAYVPLATGALLGLLLSVMLSWAWRPRFDEAPTATHSRLGMASLLAIGLTLALVGFSEAQQEAASEVERVFVPVDADGQVVGDQYFVSERFLRRLLRSSDASQPPGHWLLRDVVLRGDLGAPPADEGAAAVSWTLKFDVEILARDTTISLPLNRGEAAWSEVALLDDIPIPLNWHEGDRACSLSVREPGQYELVIPFVPLIDSTRGANRIELTLSPFPRARFQLTPHASTTHVTVSGAGDSRRSVEAGGVVSGWVDDSGRLKVSWCDGRSPGSGTSQLQVAELRWLRVRPEEVRLSAKYAVANAGNVAETFVVAADKRWELLSVDSTDAPDLEFRVTEDGIHRQLIHVELPTREADRREFTLQLRLRRASPVGRLRLGEWELTSRAPDRRLLAISIDQSLEGELIGGWTAGAGDAEAFVAAWGKGAPTEPPRWIVSVAGAPPAAEARQPTADGEAPPTLAVRPRHTPSAIEERLVVSAGAERLRVRFQADVEPQGAHRFVFPLTVPADLTIDEVAAVVAPAADGESEPNSMTVPLRWSRVADDRVNIFFTRAVDGAYRLTLDGHVSQPSLADPIPLPRIRAVSTPPTATTNLARDPGVQQLVLYREEDVLVDVVGPLAKEDSPWQADAATAGDPSLERPALTQTARPIGVYRLDEATADDARIVVRPNDVQTSGQALTRLARVEGGWWATWTCRVVVARGELGQLRLRVPASWNGPFEVQSIDSPAAAVGAIDQQSRIASVRLAEPVPAGKVLALEIRSPLSFAAGSQVAVPHIEAMGADDLRRYVSVPTVVEGQPAAWSRDGVEPAELPQALIEDDAPAGATAAFRVLAGQFNVALVPRPTESSAASVRLADTVVRFGPAGEQLVVTRLVIVPLGLPWCELHLPDEQQLISVHLANQPALLEPLGPQRWKLHLGPPNLPQSIVVVSRSTDRLHASRRATELARPTLHAAGAPLAVDLSLWSFDGPPTGAQPRVAVGRLIPAAELATLRLDRLSSIVDAATPRALELPPADTAAWYAPWVELLLTVRESAQRPRQPIQHESTANRVSPIVDEQLAAATERVDAWLQQMTALGFPDPTVGSTRAETSDPVGRELLDIEHPASGVRHLATGDIDRLTVEWTPTSLSPAMARVLGLLAIGSLVLAAIWIHRTPPARDLFWRWPHAVGVLLGLACWAWLTPGWIGLSIAAASLLLAARPRWFGRVQTPEATTAHAPSGNL